MGKTEPARKYGAPLFGAAWPSGSVFYAAGGGGKASSGIKNRCGKEEGDALYASVQRLTSCEMVQL